MSFLQYWPSNELCRKFMALQSIEPTWRRLYTVSASVMIERVRSKLVGTPSAFHLPFRFKISPPTRLSKFMSSNRSNRHPRAVVTRRLSQHRQWREDVDSWLIMNCQIVNPPLSSMSAPYQPSDSPVEVPIPPIDPSTHRTLPRHPPLSQLEFKPQTSKAGAMVVLSFRPTDLLPTALILIIKS